MGVISLSDDIFQAMRLAEISRSEGSKRSEEDQNQKLGLVHH